MKAHSLLSPSAAMRWLNCTAAPKIEAALPQEMSAFAEEGTLAHAFCAKAIKEMAGIPADDEDETIRKLSGEYLSDEMPGHVKTYADYIGSRMAELKKTVSDTRLFVEQRLDFGDAIPDCFGTADAVIITDGAAEVVDFKYGKGVKVEAQDNPQMKLYAYGAWLRYSDEYDIRQFRCTIVQPRIGNISSMEISVEDLLKWMKDTVTPLARLASKGAGWMKAGEWCRFCRARGICPCLLKQAETAVTTDVKTMTPKEVAEKALPLMETVKLWLKGVEDTTLQNALSGTRYPGWKVVEGRSQRKITDPDAVAEALSKHGYKAEDYERTELRTITDLEKLCGKKGFNDICGQWVEKPAGKPALVPESDKRPEYVPAQADFAGIKDEDI